LPNLKLTKTAIATKIKPDPDGKQVLFWDTDLRGFGVLASGKTKGKSFILQRTMPNGKSPRITVGAVGEISLEQAREQAGDLINQLRQGVNPKLARKQAGVWTLQAALDAYVKARSGKLKPDTLQDYRTHIERWLAGWLKLPLASITTAMVEARHREIQATIEKSRSNPNQWQSRPGGHAANMVFVVLRAIWNHADGRIPDLPRNPVRILRGEWFERPRRERLVTGDELPVFYQAVDALPNPTARDYVKILLWTGLRRGEASSLRWEMVDFTGRMIRLPAKLTKNKRKLDLPMSSFVSDLLVARRALGDDGGWVFGGKAKSGHIEYPASVFEQIAAACGIRVCSHDMRRTFITNAAQTPGISPMALKGLINHSLGNDVTSGYIQMTGEDLRQPAQLVCDRLLGLCGIAKIDAKKAA
jgi:integrase